MKRPEGVCKDCWTEWVTVTVDPVELVVKGEQLVTMPRWRPAPKPGPRCVTHDRAERARRKVRAHGLKVESNFGIPADLYWALYEFQGGKCAILHCRATGKSRRLAVDHDHRCCPGRTSCGKCVRGLLCGPHNEMFGRNGDDPSVFRDMADYLEMPTMMRYLWLHTGTGDRVTEYIQGLVGNAAASQTRTAAHLQRRAQGEQLDGDTSAGGVEQQ